MATIRKIISYDEIEDADIHYFFNSIPERQRSKYIRIAIRTYMAQQQEKDAQPPPSRTYRKTDNKQQQSKEENSNDEFVDADKNIYDLGK